MDFSSIQSITLSNPFMSSFATPANQPGTQTSVNTSMTTQEEEEGTPEDSSNLIQEYKYLGNLVNIRI